MWLKSVAPFPIRADSLKNPQHILPERSIVTVCTNSSGVQWTPIETIVKSVRLNTNHLFIVCYWLKRLLQMYICSFWFCNQSEWRSLTAATVKQYWFIYHHNSLNYNIWQSLSQAKNRCSMRLSVLYWAYMKLTCKRRNWYDKRWNCKE